MRNNTFLKDLFDKVTVLSFSSFGLKNFILCRHWDYQFQSFKRLMQKNFPNFCANRNTHCKCTKFYKIYGTDTVPFLTDTVLFINICKRISSSISLGKWATDFYPSIQKLDWVITKYWNLLLLWTKIFFNRYPTYQYTATVNLQHYQ